MKTFRILGAAALLAAAPALSAQDTLSGLHDAYQRDRLALVQKGASFEEVRARTEKFTERLQKFLAEEASGDDRFNGRLMLVDYLLSLGKRDEAVAALEQIDTGAAPAMVLASAAEFAGHLGMDEQRGQWIDAAIKKKEPFEQRMALAMALATRLLEPDRAQQVFDAAFEAAKTDEDRARVRWYEASALREREDIADAGTAYEEALKQLAADYPDTRWGGIAKDRLRARELEVGDEAIPFEAKTMAGGTVSLQKLAGKVVLLDFWASWCGNCRDAADVLTSVHAQMKDRGFEIVGIAMDDDCAAAQSAVEQDRRTWPNVCDGHGLQTEIALRYNVDLPGRMLLVGRDGKIAAMHLFPFDEEGAAQMRQEIEKALGTDEGK